MTARLLSTSFYKRNRHTVVGTVFAIAATLFAGQAAAEGKIRIAQQFGIAYLILDVVRDQALVEKHGKEAGLDIAVEWASISGATAMNEALLAKNLDIVSAGVPPALTMWDRTKGRQDVKLVAALGSLPNYLLTTNPAIRGLKDFTDKDRIAVPAAGVGFQSRTLQIESAKLFGPENFQKLDEISISLPHRDATAALISGGTEVNSHFSSAPFYYQALQGNKAVHKVISSYDILGGPATFNVLYTSTAFHDENPKTYAAFYAALKEAAQWINAKKEKAADTFIRQQNSKLPPELILQIINDPENDFTIVPQNTFVYARELHKLGVLKNEAGSWKDYFFPEAYADTGG
ncbi:ABC transporter substrate-binding protein [Agrobacterium rubi]|uniref:ABC transporter substrate-binding protein n=1 Tax=Agrobacterium rubi TaxID=28099 RepID=A0AAE7RDJ0_9HYPH|nr:ABC transporter substrate-binding protein [Agrobacterium rubi]NTE87911.1 ABC transporter substrate-binding protein [Agrobacterium rubi]NTF03678.1 ABC transporter substrate-binding protein [Agrobacterium rubi]NTF38004.1 ABC transporter substrate-binding protein [Agrobacterium rubi]OCJ43530.1 sulfonate ABC transporter substrate-binding protein [Agrobacterium rubi]QTG02074.1 ABC transporter substrate-binding protein [Agrobacterium rubi]